MPSAAMEIVAASLLMVAPVPVDLVALILTQLISLIYLVICLAVCLEAAHDHVVIQMDQ